MDRVSTQCAVLLEDERAEKRWVIIEDDRPVPSRGEFAADSELALRLIGHAVGEIIELPGGVLGPEKATIREVQTKYVRAFQDSIARFRERFPETSFIQHMHVGNGDDFDPTPLIESLKHRREHVDKCLNFYRTHPCTLHWLATCVGISELEAIKALAQYPTGVIRCCQTTAREFEQLYEEGMSAEVVVLDLSAIITLTLLDSWSALDIGKGYFVSQATREIIVKWGGEARDHRVQERMHASVTNEGRLQFQETTKEQYDAHCAEIEMMTQMIESHCTCRSSEGVAAMSPEKRDLFERVAGFHNIEALNLAKDLNAIFWSDDSMLALIAKAEYGVHMCGHNSACDALLMLA